MNITPVPVETTMYVVELSRKELIAIGILSYQHEEGNLSDWYTDGFCHRGSYLLEQFPDDIQKAVRDGNTGYRHHDKKIASIN